MMKRTIRYGLCGLEYVFLTSADVEVTSLGEVLNMDFDAVNLKIATEIVRQGIPLRGAEVEFLRKVIKLSLDKFGKRIGLSAPAILKWERARKKRLEPVNEVAVRAFLAEVLRVKMSGTFSGLIGEAETPDRLELSVA